MKKNILVPLFFIFLVLALIYNISNANKKIDDFFVLHKKIANLIAINKNFDIFIANNAKYKNFDYIQNDIRKSKEHLAYIEQSKLFNDLHNKSLKNFFLELQEDMNKKRNYIFKTISKTAILNNSFRYLQKVQKDLGNKELIHIFTKIVGINYDLEIDIDDLNIRVYDYEITNENEKVFISHAKIVLQYYYSFKKVKNKIVVLKVNDKLSLFEKNFSNYSMTIITDLKDVIWILMMLIFISLVVFLSTNHMMLRKQAELNKFKKAVQSSDNIIVITDKNKKIKYVNKSFEKVSGYKLSEVIGRDPSMLKSYQQSEDFYKELHDTISSGKKWKGEFINKNKDGHITFEKASITPIFDDKGNIEEYLAIKLDITKEKETDELLKEKEKLIAQQSKMAAMREMLESIAHQWRQPLSTISTAASGITLNKEFDNLTDDKLLEYTNVIVDNTQYLSKTIDNFKNYFNIHNEVTVFNLKDTTEKVLNLVGYRLNETKAEVILNSDDVQLEGLENEFIQSIINILNNSIDAFYKKEMPKRYIFIDIVKESKSVTVKIKDNAGGIDQDIIDHIFEPYFTTKHQSTGTGMGLFMVYEIIIKHFNGNIKIVNTQYEYKDNFHEGAEFVIQIPLKV